MEIEVDVDTAMDENALRSIYTQINADTTNADVLRIIASLDHPILINHLEAYTLLFERVLSLASLQSLPLQDRVKCIQFLISALQHLHIETIRKCIEPLVSIAVLEYIQPRSLQRLFQDNRVLNKRYNKRKINKFKNSFILSLMLDSISIIHKIKEDTEDESIIYINVLLEFVTDLLSMLPTRRYLVTLFLDLNYFSFLRLSPLLHSSAVYTQKLSLFAHFLHFPINQFTGEMYSHKETSDQLNAKLIDLQHIAWKFYKDKLLLLALSNLGSLRNNSDDLASFISVLNDIELKSLLDHLSIRTEYNGIIFEFISKRRLYLESLLQRFYSHSQQPLSVLPTENEELVSMKMSSQYLSFNDFAWRAFRLIRSQSFRSIYSDINLTLYKMSLKFNVYEQKLRMNASRMGLHSTTRILEVGPPQLGSEVPSSVIAEISVSLQNLPTNNQKEWDDLKPDEVLFLLAIGGSDGTNKNHNVDDIDYAKKMGMRFLRCATVQQVLDGDGRPIKVAERLASQDEFENAKNLSARRLLKVSLDPRQYHLDIQHENRAHGNIYDALNIVIRRRSRENNFKAVLQTINTLLDIDALAIPLWLQELFLGYGDPNAGHFSRITPDIATFESYDTFLDVKHIQESFPSYSIKSEDPAAIPPYTLRFNKNTDQASIDVQSGASKLGEKQFSVSVRQNVLRFTPTQVSAIRSGSLPGLTLIIGPPGTGKTDVAVQIINTLYHSCSDEKIVLVTHGNQALNQLFEKITRLDIAERHLLRLGHGQEDLTSEIDYGKQGRVDSILERRIFLLSEVDRLVSVLQLTNAHGNSCETAGYFYQTQVLPMWRSFEMESPILESALFIKKFPFVQFMPHSEQSTFNQSATDQELRNMASNCFEYIRQIFIELEEIRPFEVLKTTKDRTNYLMLKEARIIAFTSTYASIKFYETYQLGFQFQNILIEEAAQLLEVDTVIPMLMQKASSNNNFKRLIMIGDDSQLPPVIQGQGIEGIKNKADQSLFSRFIQSGVPCITLDQQGRARPTIAQLYAWRYSLLGNLDTVISPLSYRTANAGFAHEFQFINVEEFNGTGESEPTPHFLQNLGEAEYAVALYQYMRILGYPASSITILTPYAGQKALLRDILDRRCANNSYFGNPGKLATVDQYQGDQNDYIILSMVRTKSIGYMRDIRRMLVALSRGRLGLYILGNLALFASSSELTRFFDILLSKPTKLQLVSAESWPTTRSLEVIPEVSTIENVEHMGDYVYQLSVAAAQR